PSGTWLAILHAGWGPHEVITVGIEGKTERVLSRVVLEQSFNGLAFAPDGKTLYVGGGEFDVVHAFPCADAYLGKPTALKLSATKFIPGGLAAHPNGQMICVPGVWGHAVCLMPVDRSGTRITIPLEKDSYPYACLPATKGKRLFVSLWNKAAVAVIDVEE